MGRPLVPTQSAPVLTFGNQNANIFVTEAEMYRNAQGIINKELSRANEVQPYAASVDALDLAGGSSGGVGLGSDLPVRGFKRHTEGDTSGSESPVMVSSGSASPNFGSLTPADDFPSVFRAKSPLANPEMASRAMPPPPLPAGRMTRGLPRRNPFSKTMSAPVSRLGTWSGMEVDGSWVPGNPANTNASGDAAEEGAATGPAAAGAAFVGLSGPVEEEDGFDVSEWAKSEQF